MPEDTMTFQGVTFNMSGLIPALVARLEGDRALQSAMIEALWPTLLSKMVLYFRANPPAAAPAPTNPFAF